MHMRTRGGDTDPSGAAEMVDGLTDPGSVLRSGEQETLPTWQTVLDQSWKRKMEVHHFIKESDNKIRWHLQVAGSAGSRGGGGGVSDLTCDSSNTTHANTCPEWRRNQTADTSWEQQSEQVLQWLSVSATFPPSFLPSPHLTFLRTPEPPAPQVRDHSVWKAERNSMKSSSGALLLWRTPDIQSFSQLTVEGKCKSLGRGCGLR